VVDAGQAVSQVNWFLGVDDKADDDNRGMDAG
jgi:hypothetical protein